MAINENEPCLKNMVNFWNLAAEISTYYDKTVSNKNASLTFFRKSRGRVTENILALPTQIPEQPRKVTSACQGSTSNRAGVFP